MTVVVFVGLDAGAIFVGQLAGEVVVVGRSSGATVVVVVVETCMGSTGVEVFSGTLVE